MLTIVYAGEFSRIQSNIRKHVNSTVNLIFSHTSRISSDDMDSAGCLDCGFYTNPVHTTLQSFNHRACSQLKKFTAIPSYRYDITFFISFEDSLKNMQHDCRMIILNLYKSHIIHYITKLWQLLS